MILAFPNIDTTKPDGTEYVSSIDDIEKQTRTWLRDCMMEISGYPNVDTLAVKGWSAEHGRPNDNQMTNSTERHLLYFNEDTDSLEVLKKNGDVVNFIQQVTLLIYPVGSIYETTLPPTGQNSFNPNNVFGGTWEIESSGTVLVSATDPNATNHFSLGETGGAINVTLNENYIPKHNHNGHSHPHTHTRGSMNITGYFGASQSMAIRRDDNGVFIKDDNFIPSSSVYAVGPEQDSLAGRQILFNASRNWTGETSEDRTEAEGGDFGRDAGHITPVPTMPPYKVITRWIRTA